MKTIITHKNTPWIEKQIGFVNQFFQVYYPKRILEVSFKSYKPKPRMDGEKFDPQWLDIYIHLPALVKDAWLSVYTTDRDEYVKLGGRSTLRGYQPYRNLPIMELVVMGREDDWVYYKKSSGVWKMLTSKGKPKGKYDFLMPQWAYTFIHEYAHLESELRGKKDRLHEYIEKGKWYEYFTEYLT